METLKNTQFFTYETQLNLKNAKRGVARGAVIQRRIYVTFSCFLEAKTIQDFYKKKRALQNK